VDTVEIGRGDTDGWKRRGRTLRLDVADGWASQVHARLTWSMGRWQLVDEGSKNGTLLGGQRVTRAATLAAGDLIEVGRTWFSFDEHEWSGGEALDSGPLEPMPGVSTVVPALADGLEQLAAIAGSSVTVMVAGATGVGKELLARAIHHGSGRAGPFVAVNCGAIARDLVEATLFGHRRGAFSGAVEDQPGAVRAADHGTLLLDEIGDLPLPAQAALLRVLEEREVTPVGASRPVPVDVRVVAATHRDLAAMVAAGTFRSDLFYRVRGFVIALPLLGERRPDLGLITAALLRRLAGDGAARVTFDPRAVRALLAHAWPGNVRELDHALAGALVLAGARPITAEQLRLVEPPEPRGDSEPALREQLVALLTEHRGGVRAVGRALGKDPVQIRRWLRRFALDPTAFRS
jgi:transcriptional regulator with PAS, ATPase and Fis domain